MRSAGALLLLVLAAALGGCGDATTSRHDPRGTIEVAEGEKLDLSFTINPGVGYNWELQNPPRGGPLVYTGTDTSGFEDDRAGDSGDRHFRFEARANGPTTLRFRRDYRGDIVERRAVTVIVD